MVEMMISPPSARSQAGSGQRTSWRHSPGQASRASASYKLLNVPPVMNIHRGNIFVWSFVKGKIFTLKQGRWVKLRREWHSKLHVRALWCLQAMLFYGSCIFGSVTRPFEFGFLIWQVRMRVSTLRIPGFPY